MNSLIKYPLSQIYTVNNTSHFSSFNCWHEFNSWNFIVIIVFGVLFFTPLWSFLFFYLHLPFAVLYQFVIIIAKHFRFKLDNYDQWQPYRFTSGTIWCFIAKYWHGYSIKGVENIPSKGPALLIIYHGGFALDAYFLIATSLRLIIKGRYIKVVMHRSFSRLRGWPWFEKIVNVVPGTAECVKNALSKGDIILVAPGGSSEALISDHKTYKLCWENKLGFARVAIKAKVPVIPIFTENIREAYRVPSILRPLFIYLHNKLPYPIPPVYGGFPVKLTTHIGKPILFDNSRTPEQLAEVTSKAMRKLIKDNQRLPGCIWSAIKDRWTEN